ncbi:hypothetical protein PR048_022083, partial [Dryococelus australis]
MSADESNDGEVVDVTVSGSRKKQKYGSIFEASTLIWHFNDLGDRNSQNYFLSCLISVNAIKQRRPRQAEQNAKLNEFSHAYKVRVNRENCLVDIPVCFKRFLSIFGVTNRCLQINKSSLTTTGVAPIDKRGKRSQSPLQFEKFENIHLPENLNYKKLLGIFLERNIGIEIWYKNTCDANKAQEANIETLKANATDLNELKQFKDQEKLLARKQARKVKEYVAITMNYGKNLLIPIFSTGEVYYKRQLSFYQFNVHVLSDGSSTCYTYDQTIALKGSDEVASMLSNIFFEVLSSDVCEIHIFCDLCGGQNKNWTVIRFLHYVAVVLKRFDKIQITYSIRGHSYMECDKNVALISQKTPAETPGD